MSQATRAQSSVGGKAPPGGSQPSLSTPSGKRLAEDHSESPGTPKKCKRQIIELSDDSDETSFGLWEMGVVRGVGVMRQNPLQPVEAYFDVRGRLFFRGHASYFQQQFGLPAATSDIARDKVLLLGPWEMLAGRSLKNALAAVLRRQWALKAELVGVSSAT